MFGDTILPGAAHIKCGSLFAGYIDDSSESHPKCHIKSHDIVKLASAVH